jgi:hypothetical protein
MRFSLRIPAAFAVVLLLAPGSTSAQGVKLQFANGMVNLSAQNATARAVLAEWARLGGTTIVGGERMTGGPLTIELAGVTERQALEILLRDVPGYMVAARQDVTTGASRFDRIMVVPTTAAPTPAATFTSAPPAFAPNNAARDRDDDFEELEEVRRQELAQRAREAAEARRIAEQNRVIGVVTPAVTARPGIPSRFSEAEAEAARPGTPPPGPTPGNPFAPTPGSPTPGTIAPVPQQK